MITPRLGGFVLAAALMTSQAKAQSFEELQQTLKVGDKVVVIDVSDQETRGEIADLSASSLTVRVNGRQRLLRETEVKLIGGAEGRS